MIFKPGTILRAKEPQKQIPMEERLYSNSSIPNYCNFDYKTYVVMGSGLFFVLEQTSKWLICYSTAKFSGLFGLSNYVDIPLEKAVIDNLEILWEPKH